MADIVELLRDADYKNAPSRCMEAAREIERLRRLLDWWEKTAPDAIFAPRKQQD